MERGRECLIILYKKQLFLKKPKVFPLPRSLPRLITNTKPDSPHSSFYISNGVPQDSTNKGGILVIQIEGKEAFLQGISTALKG